MCIPLMDNYLHYYDFLRPNLAAIWQFVVERQVSVNKSTLALHAE